MIYLEYAVCNNAVRWTLDGPQSVHGRDWVKYVACVCEISSPRVPPHPCDPCILYCKAARVNEKPTNVRV